MRDLLGVQMSEGTVCDLIKRCAGQLAPVEQQISEALKQAEVIHQDETGLYMAGKRHWMHVTGTPTLTHYHVDAMRAGARPHWKPSGFSAVHRYLCSRRMGIVLLVRL
jgi:transposase